MKKSYRILKLRSGEELIAELRGESNNKLIIDRPMIFKSLIFPDPFGKQKEITILKNWLSHTNEIQTKIPKDFIATYLKPDSDVVELYDLEKEKQDTGTNPPRKLIDTKKKKNPPIGPGWKDQQDKKSRLEDMSEKELHDFFEMIRKNIEEDQDGMFDEMESFDSMIPPDMKNFITMTIFLPPEALMALVEGGMLDIEDVNELINSLKQQYPTKYTGNDEKRKKSEDFGNEWTDWSPDLEDYIEE